MGKERLVYAAYPLHALRLTLLICGLFAACTTSDGEKGHDEIAAPKKSLETAAAEGDVDAVRQHIAAGTDPNTQHPTNGSTPLIVAATFGHTEVARALIQGGADLEIQNSDGSTALHAAAFLCHEDIVRSLIEHGANRDARNGTGSTALQSVAGPFSEVKPIYNLLQAVLGPYGLELDYARLEQTRPRIANLLRAE